MEEEISEASASDGQEESLDVEMTDENTEEGSPLRYLASFPSPPKKIKKIKKQDFDLCLICNTTTKGTLNRWTDHSWEMFCNAAQKRMDETFDRLETYISNTEQLSLNLSQLWKHGDCYRNYTNPRAVEQAERKRQKTTATTSIELTTEQEPSTSQKAAGIPTRSHIQERTNDACLICLKERKWLSRQKKHERPMKITLISAGDAIIQSAMERNDERILREIGPVTDGGDMIAKDVLVHNSCRANYISKHNIRSLLSRNEKGASAYERAFKDLAEVVERRVIQGHEVLQMRDLAHQMHKKLASDGCSSSYRTWRLKSRLQKEFGTKLQFFSPKSRRESQVVHSTEVLNERILSAAITEQMQRGETEESEIEEDSCDLVNESQDDPDELRYAFTTNLQIHKDIQSVPQLPWPPRPEHMTENNILLPNTLYNSLAWMIGGDRFNEPLIEDDEPNSSSDQPVRRSRTPSGIENPRGELHWRNKRVFVTDDIHKKILSIGQDIIHAATSGRTLTVKHVLMAKAVQQKTGSMALVAMLNQNQHSINKTLLQEMDTANAELILSQDDLSYHMPQGMVPNVLPVFGWDNNDFNNRGHFSGSSQVHDTTGYMAQPSLDISSHSMKAEAFTSESRPKTRRRSIKPIAESIKSCIISKKKDPPLFPDAAKQLVTTNPSVAEEACATDFAWLLIRLDSSLRESVKPEDQKVPGWKGFNSMLQTHPSAEMTTVMPHKIGYCQTIHRPPDHDVIYTFLCRSVEMTDRVMDCDHGRGRCSVQIVVDMGIWFKAIQVILSKSTPDPRMNRIVLHQGPFHTAMRFLACPGFLFGSAGLRDIFIEAGVIAEGSINRVLKGDHWERGVYAHYLAAEAFHRLRFKSFVDQLENTNSLEALKQDVDSLRRNISNDALKKLTNGEAFKDVSHQYNEYISSLGQNGKFWSMYIDIVGVLLRHIRASRTGNWHLHINSELEMLPWFFACGRTVYARYKPLYLLMMLKLSDTHPDAQEQLLLGNLFTMRKSSHPFTRIPADQETEMGVNRDSKSPGGIKDVSMNPAATLKWEVLSTQRAEFVRQMSILTGDLNNRTYSPDDAGRKRIKRDEENIQLIMNTIDKWNNPFTDNGPLCHISSGRQASEEVARDLLGAHDRGKEALIQYATERLQSHPDSATSSDTADDTRLTEKTGFYGTWPKLKLKTFASMSNPKKTKIQGKTQMMRYTRDLFHKMTIIALDRGLDIDEILRYPLGSLPYSLATESGGLAKTPKSVLMHELEKLVEAEEMPSSTTPQVIILDAMALMQSLKLPNNSTFGELAEAVMRIIMKQVSSDERMYVHWVCDTYPSISIKSAERNSRMESADGSFATTISHAEQKVDKQFKKALRDGKFKESLAEFLIEEWKQPKYVNLIGKHVLYATSGSKCFTLSVENQVLKCQEIQDLTYNMEEADQRLILHAHYSSAHVPEADIVIRSPDTDVMVLGVASCGMGWIDSKCLFLTGTGSKVRYVNLTAIAKKLGKLVCDGLIGAHPFTGCDSTSAFKGKGKASVLWLLQNDATFCTAMSLLGRSLELSTELYESCEKATCILYSYNARSKKLTPPSALTVNELRSVMFSSGTSDPARLPPCQSALRKKVQRANYQAYINRNCISSAQTIPSPNGHGWIVTSPKELQIDWMDVQPAPSVVLELTCCRCKTVCKTNQCGCRKHGLKCTGICSCSKDCVNQSSTQKNATDDSSDDELEVESPISDLDTDTDDDLEFHGY